MDTKPLPVIGDRRRQDRSDLVATADYGVYVSRPMKYLGYKRVLRCTWEGLPVLYDRVAAATDERVAADPVRDCLWQAYVIGDKGFMGADGHRWYQATRGVHLLTPYRAHQRPPHPPGCQAWLNGVRARIESAFHEVPNPGRPREDLLCQTVRGLVTHVTAQMTRHALKIRLRRKAGIEIQTFTVTT